jgi:hypothetical protein
MRTERKPEMKPTMTQRGSPDAFGDWRECVAMAGPPEREGRGR